MTANPTERPEERDSLSEGPKRLKATGSGQGFQWEGSERVYDAEMERIERLEAEVTALREKNAESERLSTQRFYELLTAEKVGNAAVERLEQMEEALREGRRLVEAMDTRMPEQATEDEDGFINSYRIPVGPWHRLLGWSRGRAAALSPSDTEEEA